MARRFVQVSFESTGGAPVNGRRDPQHLQHRKFLSPSAFSAFASGLLYLQSSDVGSVRRHFAFVPILLKKSQIARRQFACCKKIRPTTADRPQSRYRGRQRVYLQAMRSPTSLHESRVYSQKKF
jgi:hypothetical protein